MKRRGFLIFAGLLALGIAAGRAAEPLMLDPVDASRDRTVPLKVYLPESGKPTPVVLFSHGLRGSRGNNAYLGNYWAEHGYVAVCMQHHAATILSGRM